MSLVNDLIRRAQAEPRPAELTINDNQVGTLVEHARAAMVNPVSRDKIEGELRAGTMQFMAIPIRVVGQSPK